MTEETETAAPAAVPVEHGQVAIPHALVVGGVVANLIAIDPDLSFSIEGAEIVEVGEADVAIGDLWNGTAFSKPLPPPPDAISDRQFFQALALNGVITMPEALAAVQTGTLPAALAAIVAAIPDATARFNAEMLLSGATVFERKHPLTAQVAAAEGWTTEQVDDFFRFAGSL